MTAPLRILLVEDSPEDVQLLRACVEASGGAFAVETAGTLAEARQLVVSATPDVILLDLMLPDSGGLETFARMQLVSGDIPIVVLTALTDEALGLKAVQAGAEDFLIKSQLHGTLLLRALQYAVERHRARRRIAFQAQLLDQVGVAVVATDPAGRVLYWNNAAQQLYGWTTAEMTGRRFVEHVISPGRWAEQAAAAMRRGESWRGDLFVRCRDESVKLVAVTQSPLRDTAGGFSGQVMFSTDVTASRAADEALRESEMRLRLFVEELPTTLWTTDAELRFTSVTGALLGTLGLSRESVIGRAVAQLADDDDVTQRSFARALNGEMVSATIEWRGFVLDAHLQPLRDADGRVVGTIGIALDVTERRRTELAAAQYMEMLSAIVDTAPVAIIALDEKGHTSLWNHRAEQVFGWTAEEVLGNPLPYVPEQDREATERWYAAFRRGAGAGMREAKRVTRDGRIVDVTVSAAPLYDAAGRFRGTMAIIEDVTAQKLGEERQQRLNAIIEASPDLVATFDVEQRALYMNSAGRRLLGLEPQQALTDLTLDAICTPSTAELIATEAVPQALSQGQWIGEGELRNAIGIEIPVWMTLVAHRAQGGGLTFISLVAHDVSESRFLEEQLRQSQKMDAIGRLAGGVAHDFNNLLTAIAGHTALLREQIGADPAIRDDLDEVMTAVERASSLTRQLLAFSRRQVLQPRLIDVNHVVTDMGRLLRRLIGEDITLNMALGSGLPAVRADRSQLEQVLMNLVVNSRDAIPGGGRIDVRTRALDVEAGSLDELRGVTPGSYVEVEVGDNGVGMDAALLSRIFEPFFTTKEQGRGTGLGLPTVYGIVTQSGGFVLVESEPGTGTTFRVLLPAASRDARDARDAPTTVRPAPRSGDGSETILLVEDEDAVRRLGRRVLERRGYTVIEAESGAEAVRIFEQHAPRIALLVSDVVMPGMSGSDLARRVREMKPSLRVLFTSGYTADAIARHGVLEPGTAFLEKPFTPEALAARVRAVLDDRND